MKASLTFNLTDQDDHVAFQITSQATKMYQALHEITMELRKLDKYSEKRTMKISQIRENILQIINSHDINLDL